MHKITSYGIRKISLFITVTLLSIVSFSCTKYEEGSAFSFMSRKKMLVGYWKMDKWIENDVEITSQLQFQHKFGFAKDGTYYYSYYDAGFKLVINFTGTWEFRRRKEQLVLGLMDPRFGMKYEVWDIIKFTRKALWLECVSPEKLVKWQLIPQ